MADDLQLDMTEDYKKMLDNIVRDIKARMAMNEIMKDITVTDENGMALIPAANLTWTVVKTGYDASLEQTLSGDENKITLTSVTGAKSEVAFASVGENEAGVVTEVKDNTVTIGIQWGTF